MSCHTHSVGWDVSRSFALYFVLLCICQSGRAIQGFCNVSNPCKIAEAQETKAMPGSWIMAEGDANSSGVVQMGIKGCVAQSELGG